MSIPLYSRMRACQRVILVSYTYCLWRHDTAAACVRQAFSVILRLGCSDKSATQGHRFFHQDKFLQEFSFPYSAIDNEKPRSIHTREAVSLHFALNIFAQLVS